MAAPPSTFVFKAEMDPAEILDYEIQLKEGAQNLLEDTEQAASYTLTLYPEAVALGLTLKAGGGYDPTNDGANITVWLEVSGGFQTDPAFDGSGVQLAMELTVITDNVPPRKRQRTVAVKVLQL
jgi:hypothetical protein